MLPKLVTSYNNNNIIIIILARFGPVSNRVPNARSIKGQRGDAAIHAIADNAGFDYRLGSIQCHGTGI